ncbi:hypothetical protein H8923_01805 [Romboutsia hominis]|uniref:Uncharacterized protein n=1 Tax=Romboutsia faecis TaxID=2764597 RepID=A0ABR7JLA7_9FIRM|nr:hypothetical protein [Romboutsia faecis]MBC5995483.1 hypothetical protein [Romboutsia faecis]
MNTVRILNPKQAGLYIKHGVKPIDIIYTDALVFIFEKNKKTVELHRKWLNRELD